MKNLPNSITAYKSTPVYTESTISRDLLNAYNTKQRVWARIVVLEGELQYIIIEPVKETLILNVDSHGAVKPTIRREVKPNGQVHFYVKFCR